MTKSGRSEDRKVTLELYDVKGQLVYKTDAQTGTGIVRITLDIGSRSSGTYLLYIPELNISHRLVIH